MADPQVAPFGAWRSPITADLVTTYSTVIDPYMETGRLEIDGPDVYWIEGRPAEAGRVVLVRRTPDGRVQDLTPPGFSVRSGVHSYGGGEFAVSGGMIVFENFADGVLYRQDVVPGAAVGDDGGERQPLTSPGPSATAEAAIRHADVVIDSGRRRVICVREDHTIEGREAVTTIVAVPLDPLAPDEGGGGPGPGRSTTLVCGNDFYSDPRLTPSGDRLAWLTWNHPDMPWDGCELWVGEVGAQGNVERAARVAGGPGESILQPTWSPSGVLHFISDRTGWWNIYRRIVGGRTDEGGGTDEPVGTIEPLAPIEAECGQVLWSWFGMSTYAFLDADRLVCAFKQDGTWQLAVLDTRLTLASGRPRLVPMALPYTEIVQVRARPETDEVIFLGAAYDEPWSVVSLDIASGRTALLRRTLALQPDGGYLSRPEPIEFPTTGGLTAHGLFYPPCNRDFAAPPGEIPPLIVQAHGGPTFAVSTAFDLWIQYWTSRGLAVLDVAYGGTTGYGRAYRRRLEGRWGIVDVDDCVSGAHHLAGQGLADAGRLTIQGASAGGYTTLAAITFRDAFRAGASYFGISDLEALARDTHKFESHYLDRLVAPCPEGAEVYRERSPIHHLELVSCPVILFQGLDDPVVPPNQAELIVSALGKRGLPVAYLAFEGEGHGFRRADTIVRCLEAQLAFYGRVLGFGPAEPLPAVEITGLLAR